MSDTLKKYTTSLLADPVLLQNLTDQYAQRLAQHPADALQLLKQWPAHRLSRLAQGLMHDLLRQLSEAASPELFLPSATRSLSAFFPETTSAGEFHRMALKLFVAAKPLLQAFLPTVTQDIFFLTGVIQELENFHTLLEAAVAAAAPPDDGMQDSMLPSALVQHSAHATLTFDNELRIRLWNPAIARQFKRTLVQAQRLPDIFPYFAQPEGQKLLSWVLAGKLVHIPSVNLTNNERYFQVCLTPLYDPQGQVQGALGVLHEHTKAIQRLVDTQNSVYSLSAINRELEKRTNELAASEQELRQMLEKNVALNDTLVARENFLHKSEARLELLADALPALVSYIDTHQCYRFVNQSYAQWFAQSKQEMIGKKVSEVIGQKAYRNIAPHIHRALQGQPIACELRQDYGKHGIRHVSVNLIPHQEENTVKGVYLLASDISHLKEVEQTLHKLYQEANQRNQALERINTDLDSFIYIASHDLKAPIANLTGLLIMLSEILEIESPKSIKIVQMMELSINKLRTTIEDLIGITKLEKEIAGQVPERVVFRQVVADIKEDIQPLIEQSQVNIEEHFEVAEISYPKSHMRSILFNLLSNAIKYRDPDRQATVTITTARKGRRCVLSVRDNGLGLTSAQQKKLFSMFKRLHSHVDGTGIGLYTIKRIIENNRGSIKVWSEPGQGTEFIVTLR